MRVPNSCRNGCRAENLQINRAAKPPVAQIAASPRDILQPKSVSFCCMITLRAQRALFSPDAGDPLSHAPLVHAIQTLQSDADEHVRDLYNDRDVIFDPSATVRDL